MFTKFVVMLALVRSDISNEMYIAIQNQKMGRITEAKEFFDLNFYKYSKAEAFITRHIEFLLYIGDYEGILKKYGHLNLELVRKANEYNNAVITKDYRKLSNLVDISPYSAVVLKACIKSDLIDKKYNNVFNYINKAKRVFSDDDDFLQYEAQYYCVKGDFFTGIKKLESLGYTRLAGDLQEIVNKFNKIDIKHNSEQKFGDWKSLYHLINTLTFSDNFVPSIYTFILDNVLYNYVQLGVKLRQSGIASVAKNLYNKRNTEETRYFYIMSLITDNQFSKAKSELESKEFSNKTYFSKIQESIDQHEQYAKEQKERENRSRERQQQRHVPRTEKAGSDFLGYYKLLGVNKNMNIKAIKKAYVKIIAKNDRMKKNEKQKAEWEKKHAKYNKALQVLSDPKKKEMYDNGIDPDSPEAQQGRYQHHEQQFKGFEDFGPFAEFFSGFGGGNGGFRQGRRTQYFYFH